MNKKALSFENPITLIGGAEVSSYNFAESIKFASNVVAADGGANTCFKYGVKPKAVIGDMDSIDENSKTQIAQDSIHFVSSQNAVSYTHLTLPTNREV